MTVACSQAISFELISISTYYLTISFLFSIYCWRSVFPRSSAFALCYKPLRPAIEPGTPSFYPKLFSFSHPKMPFTEPNRRDSWPPTILRLHDDYEGTISPEEIDEDPFAYFLTSPTPEEDEDFDIFEDLSAGIEAPDKPNTPVREVSPSSLQRTPLDIEDDSYLGLGIAVPLSLRDFSLAHEKKKSEKSNRKHLSAQAPALRVRRTVRLAANHTIRSRGHARTRSHSAPRPHSWREPSPDVWSIPEEKEDMDVDDVPLLSGDEDPPAGTVEVTGSAKDEPRRKGEVMMVDTSPQKIKKRVHWATLPRRHA